MNRRPLHNELTYDALQTKPLGANAGLWHNKFFDSWADDTWKLDNGGQQTWLSKLLAQDSVGQGEQISHFCERAKNRIKAMSGHTSIFATSSAFITGMGLAHPSENGFTWHHTLGAPYLPGSSLKGLMRNWAEYWLAEDESYLQELGYTAEAFKAKIALIFGGGQQAGAAGSIVFHDVLPLGSIRLKAEIMTPHYGKYYQEGQAPGDWLSPIPLEFLAVASEQKFLFGFSPRLRTNTEQNTEQNQVAVRDCELLMTWLTEALEWVGVGAKAASGYGRFSYQKEPELNNQQKQEIERKQEQEKATSGLQGYELKIEQIILRYQPGKTSSADVRAWVEEVTSQNWPNNYRLQLKARIKRDTNFLKKKDKRTERNGILDQLNSSNN